MPVLNSQTFKARRAFHLLACEVPVVKFIYCLRSIVMFCPRCSIQNETEQEYCRQCGLALSRIRLAISGRAGEALSRYKKGSGALSTGTIILIVCILIALLNFFLSSEPRNYGMLLNLLLGLLVALPMIISGLIRVSRAGGLLKGQDPAVQRMRGQPGEPASLPPDTGKIHPSAASSATRNSITEQTTIKLKRQ